MSSRLSWLLALTLAACGSNAGSQASSANTPFVAQSAAFTTVTSSSPDADSYEQGFLILSSSPNICADFPSGVFHRNMTFVVFSVTDSNALAKTVAFTNGTYPVNDTDTTTLYAAADSNNASNANMATPSVENVISLASTGNIADLDAHCKYELVPLAAGGGQSLTITNLDETTSAIISYDLKTQDGVELTGRIKAVACNSLLDLDVLNGLKAPVGTVVCAPQ